MEPTTTAFEHSVSKLSSRLSANYQIQADDPIHNLTGMLDRIEQIKEAMPKAVSQSLELAAAKLSTEFGLVSDAMLTSIQAERGTLSAVHTQLVSLEKRFINSGNVAPPEQKWNFWLLLGCTFTILGLLGYNTFTARSTEWAQTDTGRLAKQMVDRNPQLAASCRSLTAKDYKQLGKNHQAKKVCSVLL
jgi:hypothetical protein